MTEPSCPKCEKPVLEITRSVPKCEPLVDKDGREWIGTEVAVQAIHTDGTRCEL